MMNARSSSLGSALIYACTITIATLITVQEYLLRKTDFSEIGIFDELLLLFPYLALPIIIWHQSKIKWWIVLIYILPILSIIYGIAAYTALGEQPKYLNIIIQSFINFKFFIFFILFNILLAAAGNDTKIFVSAFIAALAVSLTGYALNIFIPDQFFFSDKWWHIERDRIVGFQFKPNDLALFLSFSFSVFLFSSKSRTLNKIIPPIAIFLIAMTGSRTATALAVYFFLCHMLINRKYPSLLFLLLASIATAILFHEKLLSSFFFKETLSNILEAGNIEHTQYIRMLVIYYGLYLSFHLFPFGSGPATYATVMSDGSHVYRILNLENNHFFANKDGIYDSNIASIMGEYGIIFTVLLIILCYKTLNYIFFNERKLAIVFLLAILIVSVTQPMFSYHVNSVSVLLAAFSIKHFRYKSKTI